MYDLQYVRKRRRRRIAAFVALFASIGVTSLVITSFLGRRVGSFTVSLQNSSVQLALSEKESYENPTSYLRIDKIPSEYYEYSYDWFERTGFEHVDDENNNAIEAGSDPDQTATLISFNQDMSSVSANGGSTRFERKMYADFFRKETDAAARSSDGH